MNRISVCLHLFQNDQSNSVDTQVLSEPVVQNMWQVYSSFQLKHVLWIDACRKVNSAS